MSLKSKIVKISHIYMLFFVLVIIAACGDAPKSKVVEKVTTTDEPEPVMGKKGRNNSSSNRCTC